jgi:hypothetical protein
MSIAPGPGSGCRHMQLSGSICFPSPGTGQRLDPTAGVFSSVVAIHDDSVFASARRLPYMPHMRWAEAETLPGLAQTFSKRIHKRCRLGHLLLTSKQVDVGLERLEPQADESVCLKATETEASTAKKGHGPWGDGHIFPCLTSMRRVILMILHTS